MIKKGLIGMDDYIRFGKFVDSLEKMGAYSVMWVPKKDMFVVTVPRDRYQLFYDALKVKGTRKGGFAIFKVKWK